MSLTKEDLSALSQMLDQQMENHLHPIKMELNELKTAQQQTQKDIAEIKSAQQQTQKDVAELKSAQQQTQKDIAELKSAQQQTQKDVAELKSAQQQTQKDVTALKLHLENTTDKGLQLLAENHITLVNKLNQAIPAVEKNLVYEVRVNYLMEEMQILKKDVAFLKSKIA